VKILWCSNAMWAHTGYAVQAQHLLPRLQALGHDVAQFAWWGLRGGVIRANGITIYPRGRESFGYDVIGAHAEHFGADLVISLQDVWVLPNDYVDRVGRPWACWFPVDQDPAPSDVVRVAKTATYPIVYSQFGARLMLDAGVPCHYIPHGVNMDVFKPSDETRAVIRERLGWSEGAFVAAIVAANKGYPSRKAYPEQMMAFAAFAEDHPRARLYVHANKTTARGGLDLCALAGSLEIEDRVIFVDQYDYLTGLPDTYMADVYNAADVLLAATMTEGFGIPIVEAQACGCPVITTGFSSMPELTVNGIVTEALQPFWTTLDSWCVVPSVADITRALHEVAAWSPETRRNNARRGVVAMGRYDWNAVVATWWRPFLCEVARDIGQ
jgi:glycosyltransferase involved in cell wall biosynthesis